MRMAAGGGILRRPSSIPRSIQGIIADHGFPCRADGWHVARVAGIGGDDVLRGTAASGRMDWSGSVYGGRGAYRDVGKRVREHGTERDGRSAGGDFDVRGHRMDSDLEATHPAALGCHR